MSEQTLLLRRYQPPQAASHCKASQLRSRGLMPLQTAETTRVPAMRRGLRGSPERRAVGQSAGAQRPGYLIPRTCPRSPAKRPASPALCQRVRIRGSATKPNLHPKFPEPLPPPPEPQGFAGRGVNNPAEQPGLSRRPPRCRARERPRVEMNHAAISKQKVPLVKLLRGILVASRVL